MDRYRDFEEISVIGKGSTSVVIHAMIKSPYLANKTGLDEVALKVMEVQGGDSREVVIKQFRFEIALMG